MTRDRRLVTHGEETRGKMASQQGKQRGETGKRLLNESFSLKVSAAGGKQEVKKQRTSTAEGLPIGTLGNSNIPTSTKFQRAIIQPDEAPKHVMLSVDSWNAIERRLEKLDLLANLCEDLSDVKKSMQFHSEVVSDLQKNLEILNDHYQNVKETVAALENENVGLKQTVMRLSEDVLDSQCRSMRDNLVFEGLPEKESESCEEVVRDFLVKNMKIGAEAASKVQFDRAHRLGAKGRDKTRPIVVKMTHFKDKEMIKKQKKTLSGSNYGVNDQFPSAVMDRRKRLFPLMKKARQEGKKAVVVVDRLYINDRLYTDPEVCPWLSQRLTKRE